MLAAVLLNINAIQGYAIYAVEYQENLSKAGWLAKGIMAKVEYEWKTRDFEDLEYVGQEKEVDVLGWGRDNQKAFEDFRYAVKIEEWKLPLLNLITGTMGGEKEGSQLGDDFITEKIKDVLGDELIKIAHVEVFWPEGARRNSTDLTMILTNEKSIDRFISAQKGSELIKKPKPKKK